MGPPFPPINLSQPAPGRGVKRLCLWGAGFRDKTEGKGAEKAQKGDESPLRVSPYEETVSFTLKGKEKLKLQ